MKKILCCLLMFSALIPVFCFSQQWIKIDESSLRVNESQRVIRPQKFSLIRVNTESLLTVLQGSPLEFSDAARNGNDNILLLPMPDGSIQRFKIFNSPIMAPQLAGQFPGIITFSGQGIDDLYATIRMDYNPYFGFHAQVLSINGNVYIDPYARGDINDYMSYYTRDYRKDAAPFVCHVGEFTGRTGDVQRIATTGPCRGTQLYTYRLAVACTGEYAVAVCTPSSATVPATLAAIVTSVNRVSGVYETELAVRLTLVGTETNVVFIDPATDPFTGNNNASVLINESQTVIDANIGNGNYDIGHTFSTGGGGLAQLNAVCNSASKAKGITGSPSPVGDAYDIDYVAHEMGHEFGANHTFNSTTSNCGGGNRNASTAYEVGSGTTIMAYAGICGSDDIQPHSDPFFHTVSFDEISTFLSGSGGGCAAITSTGNTLPVITAMNNNGVTIPELTPFTLTATATDANGDALTYCWEEWDLGPADAWDGGASSLTKPLFKSRIPKTTGTRTIPDINVILAGYPANPPAVMDGLKGETLSDPNGTQARTINFRLTVRDNRSGGGGIVTGGGDGTSPGCAFATPFSIDVKGGTGAFAVIAPNGGETWLGGTMQTISWSVASTSSSPISTANVSILMSTDGGLTYPTTILSSTPNDGSQLVTIPNIATNTTVRFKVQAIGNIFFDISNANFTITFNAALPVGLLNFTVTAKTNTIDLDWQTAYEQNNNGFEIQRSDNSTNNFSVISFMPGHGNSQQTVSYSFTDHDVRKNQRYYYRLRQIDNDGASKYSPVRSAVIKDSKLVNIRVTPNPAKEKLLISLGNNSIPELNGIIMDASGRIVLRKTFKPQPNATLELNVSKLSSGIYFLQLITGDDKEIIKFVKE